MTVTFNDQEVDWTRDLEVQFQRAVYQQISNDDWDSLSPSEEDVLRSFWYHGYITARAGAGSY